MSEADQHNQLTALQHENLRLRVENIRLREQLQVQKDLTQYHKKRLTESYIK